MGDYKILKINKKGIAWKPLLEIITGLLALGVLIFVLVGGLKGSQRNLDQTACSLSAKANCYGKVPITGIETFGVKCKVELETITMKELKAEAKGAKKKMEALAIQFKALEGKNRYVTRSPSDDLAIEFVLNRKIAEKMKTCLGLFQNIPCLFSRWWAPFQCTGEDDKDCDEFLEVINAFNWNTTRIPAYCVVCARLKFDDKIYEMFKEKKIDLSAWMDVNSISPTDKTTHTEFIKRGIDNPFEIYTRYYYTIEKEKPLAIVFGRVNLHAINSGLIWAGKGVEWLVGFGFGKGVAEYLFGEKKTLRDYNYLFLIPFEDLKSYCLYW